MNPPLLISFTELIYSQFTNPAVMDSLVTWLETINRNVAKMLDSPGFMLNSLLFPLINRAIYLLQDTGASAETIDGAMKSACGHKMGPLETADLIGLDTVNLILLSLARQSPEFNAPPAPLLSRMLENGEFGKKSKKGFYDY